MSQQMMANAFTPKKSLPQTLKGGLFLDSSYFSIPLGLGKMKNSGIFGKISFDGT